MYLTARSYLLAGFTAATIVATIPFAPRSTVHLPDTHAADVRLAAAESEIAATVRTLRAVEARAVASAVAGATTTVVPDGARRTTATTSSQPAPSASKASSAVPTATTHQPARRASAAAPAVTVPISVVGPVAGDLLAFGLDLAGTPSALMSSVSFIADTVIASATGGTTADLPPGFGIPQRFDVISADVIGLNDALHHLGEVLQSGTGDGGSGTRGAVNTGAGAVSNSGTVTAAATGGPDTSALLPLIGDVAILGIDMTASSFAVTQTWTRALAAASTDLGAGQIQAAQTAFTTILRAGLAEPQTRLTEDRNNIGAVLARLVGTARTTTGKVGSAKVAGAADAPTTSKTASTPAIPRRPINTEPRPVVTKPTSSTPAAKADSADHHSHGRAHTPGATAEPTRHGGNAGSGGRHSAKAGGSADGTGTAKHAAAPGQPHKDGAKHRKH